MAQFSTQTVSGWGNYSSASAHLYRPERQRELPMILREQAQPDYIARGLGRSYGDSAINRGGGVILGERLNRFLTFDPSTGEVECEGGVSLAEIIEVFLPRGYFLPVTPGTKFVTVGGAIAADVHGKNHHIDGTLSRFVTALKLLTAAAEVIECSPTLNSEIFWATVGGMGLTGFIISARIRLLPVESAFLHVRYQRANNLDHALDLLGQDAGVRYSVAWIDCLARGAEPGKVGPVIGRSSQALADLPTPFHDHPLTVRPKRRKSVPFNFPNFALNRLSVKLFNHFYYAAHKDSTQVVDYDTFFYPLDGIMHWNRMYGRKGFVQYQALFPAASSRAGLTELLEKVSGSGIGSFLAVLKSTGPAGMGLLSYPYEGHTLALDLPNRGEHLIALLARLDALVLKHGGRLYLAKDATMSAETFQAMYPRLPEFRAIKRTLDTQRVDSPPPNPNA